MREPGLYAWRNPWWRWSVLFVCGTAVVSVLVGFIWLPSVQGDFSAQGRFFGRPQQHHRSQRRER